MARFVTVRRLTESEGLGLSEVRRVLMSRGDAEALRDEVDRVRATGAADGQALRDLERRVAALEARIAAIEAAPARRAGCGRSPEPPSWREFSSRPAEFRAR